MRSHRNIILLFFLGIFSISSPAQESVQDSLRKLLNENNKEDTIRIKLLLELAKYWYPRQVDSMVKYNAQALDLSRKLQFKLGLIRALNGKALVLSQQQQFQEAHSRYQEALRYAEEIHDMYFLVTITNNVGILFQNQGSLDSAEQFFLRSIDYARVFGNPGKLAKSLSDLAGVAGDKGDVVTAIQILNEVKAICEENKLLSELMITWLRLGIQYSYLKDFLKSKEAYEKTRLLNDSLNNPRIELTLLSNLGYLYYDVKGDFDSARIFMFRAKKLAEEMDDKSAILINDLNLGNTYYQETNYPEALKYYTVVYTSPLINYYNLEKTGVTVNLGTIYLSLGDLKKAETFSAEGLRLAKKNKILRFELNACQTLATIKSRRGDWKSAAQYQDRTIILKDSLYNEQITERVAEIEFLHKLKIKDTENQLLLKENEVKEQVITRQRMIVTGVSIILVLLLLLLVIILRSRNKQKALNHQLDEQNIQLKKLNQTKDKFFSIIAHDLKSPFNALLGLLQELDTGYGEIDEQSRRKIIHDLRKSSQNTYGLLVNLLEWTQAQRGTLTNSPVQVVLHNLVDEVFNTLRTRADVKAHHLINQTDPCITVWADAAMLQSLFLNLINNAIKFTPLHGTIRVTSEQLEHACNICVVDTGIGIPEGELENLFRVDKPFNRPGTDKEAGTGLGLILCKEYIEILKGTVTVTSKEGEGSVFCVTIPLTAVSNQ